MTTDDEPDPYNVPRALFSQFLEWNFHQLLSVRSHLIPDRLIMDPTNDDCEWCSQRLRPIQFILFNSYRQIRQSSSLSYEHFITGGHFWHNKNSYGYCVSRNNQCQRNIIHYTITTSCLERNVPKRGITVTHLSLRRREIGYLSEKTFHCSPLIYLCQTKQQTLPVGSLNNNDLNKATISWTIKSTTRIVWSHSQRQCPGNGDLLPEHHRIFSVILYPTKFRLYIAYFCTFLMRNSLFLVVFLLNLTLFYIRRELLLNIKHYTLNVHLICKKMSEMTNYYQRSKLLQNAPDLSKNIAVKIVLLKSIKMERYSILDVFSSRHLCRERILDVNSIEADVCRLKQHFCDKVLIEDLLTPDGRITIFSKLKYLSSFQLEVKTCRCDFENGHFRKYGAFYLSEKDSIESVIFCDSNNVEKINCYSCNEVTNHKDFFRLRMVFNETKNKVDQFGCTKSVSIIYELFGTPVIKAIMNGPVKIKNVAIVNINDRQFATLCSEWREKNNSKSQSIPNLLTSMGKVVSTQISLNCLSFCSTHLRIGSFLVKKCVKIETTNIKILLPSQKLVLKSPKTKDYNVRSLAFTSLSKTPENSREEEENSITEGLEIRPIRNLESDVRIKNSSRTSALKGKNETFSPEPCFFIGIFVWKLLLLLAIKPDCGGRFDEKKKDKKGFACNQRSSVARRGSKGWRKAGNKLSIPTRPFWPLLFFLFVMIAGTEAVCPRLCACKWKGGKQTVECINKGLTTIPSDIDPGTQVLDMTGNPLVIISRDKFKVIGLTNLQRIYATRCKLVQLDDAAFRGLSNLVELDLSNNELRIVPAASFQHLPSLMRLQLSHNPITLIKDGSFRGLGYLTSLELTSCNIEKVEPLAFQGLDRLEWLKIDANNLTTMPSGMMLPKSLHGVDIHNNPWRCDCNLRQLRQWLVQYNVPSSIQPKCLSPMRLRSRVIKEIIPMELACAPELRPTSLFLDVVEGKNVSFECHVKATPEAEVTWKFNSLPLENSSFSYDETTSLYVFEDRDVGNEKISHLRIEMVNEAHSGIFQCIAENEADKAVSNFSLRVSAQPTKPAPEVPVKDNMMYIVGALIAGVVFVLIVLCIIIVRCCRNRRPTKKPEVSKCATNKDNDRPKSVNMPKYIQMGKPAPKLNGILVDTPPISVIENSPYRNDHLGTTNINPDLISDGPEERVKPPKKKVSIVGVEEMDASGNRVTRKLDDIEEEDDPHFNSNNFDQTSDYEPNYASLNDGGIDGSHYPLTVLSPEQQVPQTNGYYDIRGFPREAVLVDHTKRYSPIPSSDQSSLYASLRRSRRTASPLLVSDQKYPESFGHESPYAMSEGRYSQPTKNCDGSHSFYECCQPIPQASSTDYDPREPLGRIRGDGCSFDNLLSSCGGHCCYNENHHHGSLPQQQQLFDNSLPENYRPLEGPPPPPPAGYGDSEDEVDDEVKKNWEDEVTLSPGTRVLYSPKENTFSDNNAVTNV